MTGVDEMVCDVCDQYSFDCAMGESEFYAVFRLLFDNNCYHWGQYVVFLAWVSYKNGDVMAQRVYKKIRKEHPKDVPSIPYLIAAWIRAGCGPDRTHDE